MPFIKKKTERNILPTERPNNYEKSIPFGMSTIENVDAAMLEYLQGLEIFATTHKGFNEVPVVWVTPERSFLSKKDGHFRDSSGALILPIVALERVNVTKDPTRKGTVWGNMIPVPDEKGGTIKIARRLKQDKTSNFQNAHAKRSRGQLNFPGLNSQREIYETITMPLPVYITVKYKITIRTEYQQQMNEVLTPFITKPGGINYIIINKEGHKYEGFVQSEFKQDNNFSSFGSEERRLETSIEIDVLAYLTGEGKNQAQPKYTIRENAVEIRLPRERIVFGDFPEREDGRFYGLAGIAQEMLLGEEDRFVTPFVYDRAAGSSGGGSGGTAANTTTMTTANYVPRGSFTETPDAATTEFTVSEDIVEGTEMVFVDGVLMTNGADNDYTISGRTITFTFAPNSGDNLTISYVKA